MRIRFAISSVFALLFIGAVGVACAQPYFGYALQFSSATGSEGTAATADGAGNAIVVGQYRGTCDFDPSAGVLNHTAVGAYDFFLAKYDPGGNLVWANSMGGTNDDWPLDLLTDSLGNIYVSGRFMGTCDLDPSAATANITSAGGYDMFLAKYDASGNYIWGCRLGYSFADDIAADIDWDRQGNIVMTGRINGIVDMDPGPGVANIGTGGSGVDWFAARYTSNGDYLWALAIGSPHIGDFGVAIAADHAGGVIVTGLFQDSLDMDPSAATYYIHEVGNYDIFIARYTSTGLLDWAGSIGNANAEIANAVRIDHAGNILLAGSFAGTVDFDITTGSSFLSSVSGNDNCFVAKYDLAGNNLQAYKFGSGAGVGIQDMRLDGAENVISSGGFGGTCDFDASPSNTANLTAGTLSDVFVAAYDPTGTFLWVGNIGGNGVERCNKIYVDPASGDCYITGYFWDEIADFDPTPGSFNMDPAGNYKSGYLAKWTSTLVHADAAQLSSSGFSIRPNPSSGKFFIDLDFDAEVRIYNVKGDQVYQASLLKGSHLLEVNQLTNGLYCVSANGKTKQLMIYE